MFRHYALLLILALLYALPMRAQEQERQVWAFYLSFWTGEASWNNVARVLDDLPAIGKYNSKLPDVAAQHIAQAQSAGIDGFWVSWFGADERVTTTPALLNLLHRAEEVGFQVGAVVDVYNPAFNRDYTALRASLSYLISELVPSEAYLRYDGKPVIAFAFQDEARFSPQAWRELREAVDPDRTTLWLAEGLSACCLYGGAMDGMYAFNMAWASGIADYYLAERNLIFERGGAYYIPSVSPAWDESKIARIENRPRPTSPRGRAEGAFLRDAWQAALKTNANAVIVVTWNEFMENSHIEPSERYGTQSLDTLRALVGAWRGAWVADIPAPPTCYDVISGGAPAYDRPQGETVIATLEEGVRYPLLNEDYGYYEVALGEGRTAWAVFDSVRFVPCAP
jgi:hypothetical protein